MSVYLGIDTSNYTTSVALYDGKNIRMQKKLLPTPKDSLGLRQSDAVFAHIKQIEELFAACFADLQEPIAAVGVSSRPRSQEGSYMPCFLVGSTIAGCVAAALHVEKFCFSHQDGHIAAALYSADKLDWLEQEFYAFHVSGGTTECVLVKPPLHAQLIAQTLDLNAGQLIDRVGKLLGLPFPAGPALAALAQTCPDPIQTKPTLKGLDCCLSGVQNQCEQLLKAGKTPAYIAAYAIESVRATLEKMARCILASHGDKPLLFAGGVMSNRTINQSLTRLLHCAFAAPQYSADNSAGIAVLTALRMEGKL